MNTDINFILLGLGTGAIYALAALGIVTIHRGSKTLNFSHGGIALWAAYLFEVFRDNAHMPAVLAGGLSVVLGAVFGVFVYLAVIRPIRHRTAVTRMVATLGVASVLTASADRVFVNQPHTVISSFPVTTISIFGHPVSKERIILLGIALALTAGFALWSARARLPLGTRAMAEHERAAQGLGYSPHVLGVVNWALGCGLAALSGVLVAPLIGIDDVTMTALGIYALSAALVGRFDSFWLALVGGLTLGVVASLVTHLASQYLPANYTGGWSEAVPFVVVVLVLIARRDRASNRLPAVHANPVASGRVDWRLLAGGVIAAAIAIPLLSAQLATGAITTMCYAILALSLVVLIGFANQISLAQMGIAGLGAFVAARLAIGVGLPFEIAPLIGALVGALAGVLIGLPAVRIRGVNLAVVTIGIGLALSNVLFANGTLTGGLSGLQPPTPRVFGLDVSTTTHADRYGYVSLFWLVVAVLAVLWLRRSRLGGQLLVVRTNERAAEALGIKVARSKLIAFAISSSLAGAAGVLLGFRQSSIDFSAFSTANSIALVVVVIIAGVGSLAGGLQAGLMVSGGIIFVITDLIHFNWLNNNYDILFGIGLVVTVLLHPNGITWRRKQRPAVIKLPAELAPSRSPLALVANDIRVSFGGVKAVVGASLTVEPGTVVGLVGPNGAGKTALLDAISGFAAASSGSVSIGGEEQRGRSASERARAGMGRVFQGGELFEDLTVAQNIKIAAENLSSHDGRMPAAAQAAIARFGLEKDLQSLPSELSMAKRRFVAVARALAGNPTVLMLDEPGAGLSMSELSQLREELRHLAADLGLGILIVDHDMGLVMSACDRVVVMQFGQVLLEGTPAEVLADVQVRAAYLGAESDPPTARTENLERVGRSAQLAEVGASGGGRTEDLAGRSRQLRVVERTRPDIPADEGVGFAGRMASSGGEEVLVARDLSVGYGAVPVLRSVNLPVRRGEFVSLLGPNGAGKTTLLAAFAGHLTPANGEVLLFGKACRAPAHHRARLGLGYVGDDRHLFPGLTVRQNLRLIAHADAVAMDRFPELGRLRSRRAGLLSGGEQQMLSLARCLAMEPSIVMVDELSLGLAPVVRERLLAMLRQVADDGAAVLVVEQNVRQVLQVADQAHVLIRGEIADSRPAAGWLAELDALGTLFLS